MRMDNWSPEELLEIEANRSPDYECRLQDDIVCKRKKGKALAIYYAFMEKSYDMHANSFIRLTYGDDERYSLMKYDANMNKITRENEIYRTNNWKHKSNMRKCKWYEGKFMQHAIKSEYYKIWATRTKDTDKIRNLINKSYQHEICIDKWIEKYDKFLNDNADIYDPLYKNLKYDENKTYPMNIEFEKDYTNDPNYHFYPKICRIKNNPINKPKVIMTKPTLQTEQVGESINLNNAFKNYNEGFEKIKMFNRGAKSNKIKR